MIPAKTARATPRGTKFHMVINSSGAVSRVPFTATAAYHVLRAPGRRAAPKSRTIKIPMMSPASIAAFLMLNFMFFHLAYQAANRFYNLLFKLCLLAMMFKYSLFETGRQKVRDATFPRFRERDIGV